MYIYIFHFLATSMAVCIPLQITIVIVFGSTIYNCDLTESNFVVCHTKRRYDPRALEDKFEINF